MRELVTVAEVTATIRNIAAEVQFDHVEAGLDRPSVINCDGLHTITRSSLTTPPPEVNREREEAFTAPPTGHWLVDPTASDLRAPHDLARAGPWAHRNPGMSGVELARWRRSWAFTPIEQLMSVSAAEIDRLPWAVGLVPWRRFTRNASRLPLWFRASRTERGS